MVEYMIKYSREHRDVCIESPPSITDRGRVPYVLSFNLDDTLYLIITLYTPFLVVN